MTLQINFTVLAGVLLLVLGSTGQAAEFKERAVEFKGAGGTTIRGTLLLPAGEMKFPALVLLAGSGPTDRNGNQPPLLMIDLLKQVAQTLAHHGVASLRFDKRGMHANIAETPKDRAAWGEYFTWENFVGDSVAAVQFLREQPEIDPARVGIGGHSEGGVLALMAAKDLTATGKPPSVLVLLSTPGRNMDVLVAEQIKRLLGQQHATTQQTQFYMDENARIQKAIREQAVVPSDVPPGLQMLYPGYLGKFLHGDFLSDPALLAVKYPGPVLLITGASDIQVSPERDSKVLDTALKSRKPDDHTLFMVPSASHNLKIVQGEADPGFRGDVAPEALKLIGEWVEAKLTRSQQ